MLSGSITLLIWAGIFFIMSIVTFVFGCLFVASARRYNAEAEKMVKAAELRIQRQYNRIATMPYGEFNDYIIASFAKSLEIVSYQDISKLDPDGAVTLYALAVEQMLKYIGDETIEAIEYYYGKEYITRWTLLAYQLLEKRGIITAVISQKQMKAESIIKSLTEKREG